MKNIKKSCNDDCLKVYFAQIKNIPLLTFEEELELSRRIRNGDETARRRLIEANLKLVVKVSRSYASQDIPLMDLIQEGNIGLMRAADKYDDRRQVRFSTYAVWWIRQSISRYLCNKRRTIRLPHRKEEALRKIQWAYYTLNQLYMRPPRSKELAAETGISKEDVDLLLCLAHDFIFCENKKDNNESANTVESQEDYTYSPEQILMRKSSREAALQALNHLKDREKRILIYRYQLDGGKRHTLKNISDKIGLSAETVRQTEIRALRKLRSRAGELKSYIMVPGTG